MKPSFEQHLYVILWPNTALVASNLDAPAFGRHYSRGSSRYFEGLVLFAEIDPAFRHDYFQIDRYLKEVVPLADGRPKRTKFISTYRVMEHVALDAFRELHLVSVGGQVLTLPHGSLPADPVPDRLRIYQEVCPLRSTVLSVLPAEAFGSYVTDMSRPKAAPKVLFTEIALDADAFLSEFDADPFHGSPLPNVHPQKLRQQILEFRAQNDKKSKGLSVDSAFGKTPFFRLRGGFWIAEGHETLCYPIPPRGVLEKEQADWLESNEDYRYR